MKNKIYVIFKILNIVKNIIIRKLLKIRYINNSHEKVFDWNWDSESYNRIALVNFLIHKTGGLKSSYLEIGCQNNTLFHSVSSLNKIGVDPVSGGTHHMTSDYFFDNNNKKFDVIFIDGLHHYEQVRKDTINALSCLKKNGWIALHDFLPSSWEEQHVPRISNDWTGDCWKLALELTKSTGINFKIIKIDQGIGLIKKEKLDWKIPDLSKHLKTAQFDVFVQKVDELPIFTFEEALK